MLQGPREMNLITIEKSPESPTLPELFTSTNPSSHPKSMLKSRSLPLKRFFSSSSTTRADYSHAIIGGGVVGLSIAAELAKREGNKVLLIEKNTAVGQETSSRNSEVIHAGLYYPKDSLKTKLCIEGKELIYSEAKKAGVEMKKVGKWIVAQTDVEDSVIEHLHYKAKDLGIKTELIPSQKGQYIEPAVQALRGILSSPTTGIISAHSLMDYLQAKYQQYNGELALGSKVVRLSKESSGYNILVKSIDGDEVEIKVENVVNSAGLYADKISNSLLPGSRHKKLHFAKGNYYSFNQSFPEVRRLIYPVPRSGLSGLGTHLTLDLEGQIRFGPDVEWVDSPDDLSPSDGNKEAAYREILRYLPHIMIDDLEPSYAGIRPKLTGPGEEAADYYIKEEEDFPGFVNLLGIESPGLTSAMAIGRYVADIYHK